MNDGAGRRTPDKVPHQVPDKINWKTDHGAAELAQVPEELITEILFCSSVKSLLRFRCLSKSFCSVIDSDEFIRLQHKRSFENKKHRKMIIGEEYSSIVNTYDVDTGGLGEKIKIPVHERYPKPYGYCNGLILLSSNRCTFALWNPSTHKYRYLPPCPAVLIPQSTGAGHFIITGMGLGYDSTRDDYKVVLIAHVKKMNIINTYELQVWVFGLRSNSWRRGIIEQNFPYIIDKFFDFGYFANGFLYWLYRPYVLLAFDVAKETMFKPTSDPALSDHYPIPFDRLHVLDGCLYMSCVSMNRKKYILYVLKKDGIEFKWKEQLSLPSEMWLLFDMSMFMKNVRFLGYSREGDHDKLMMDFGFKFILLYDLKDKSFTRKSIKLVGGYQPTTLCNVYPFLCVESLASVDDGGDSRQVSGKKRKVLCLS